MSQKTQQQKIGKIGEDLACKFLVKHGYKVIQRNYLKIFGEIDIICSKGNILHFVEVKAVSRITFEGADEFRPEDNVHSSKLARIGRTIEAYLYENPTRADWQFDVIAVQLDNKSHLARINMISDLII